MKLLVFGQTGQVARALARLAPDAVFLGRDQADLTDPAACARAILAARPDAVINAAAYTAVDKAETDEATAHLVNALAPEAMARACAEVGVPLVHISTDYVFDGAGDSAFLPTDPVAPLGAYGRTKAEGEARLRGTGATHGILRTSWVFSPDGSNFVKTMLRLSETRDRLTVVGDQVGGPTPAAAIAQACMTIADRLREGPALSGSYHFSGAPDTSWAGFARAIFELSGRKVEVVDIPTADYPTPARRPLNSRLDCTTTEATFGLARPDWRAGLRDAISDLKVLA
ncbi:dTDP-4-dehydrorhamnose reductase [Pseudotabrizicola alkalilacus]|uniref:dTDP-4-dehydrorhamnose reductase n=1 Tax=Pseudotabrizicola alkalilacus TaxID=2305252 RepID=A0A411YX14_9RHOB|nr:dTDP-4-dehydrorhamnose reductase [Pseudotabrizicola alkalilacus]RGP35320.1 dTDP-4-dehydrorhamnose reductase [Pseudotabrizicola alkalilacus]